MTTSQRTYEQVFEQECRRVVHAAFLVLGDWQSAQEVAQDCFAELFVRWARIQHYDDSGAWLRRIAIRRAARVRSRRRVALRDLTEPEDPQGRVPVRMDLHRALLELPVKQRAAVVLYYLEDVPAADIARLLRCAPSTVRVQLHHGRERLRVLLDPVLIEEPR